MRSGELSSPRRLLVVLAALLGALCLWAGQARAAVVLGEGTNTVTTPNFEWDFGDEGGNVERVAGLKWRRDALSEAFGPNLAAAGGGACGDPSEFWGQSYGNADGQGPGPVVGGNRGAWSPRGQRSVEINTIAPEGCSGDTPPIPVRTRYTFFDSVAAANTVRIERRFSFAASQEPYIVQGIRAYVPRLPYGTYNQTVFPNAAGSALITEGLCNVCIHSADWNKTWVALNSSASNAGMLILRDPGNLSPASITLDYDSSSGSNNSGISLDRPTPDGWKEALTETEYFCFYDATSWPVAQRLTTLPSGCAAATAPINTAPPALSAGAGSPRAGEQFFAAPGKWDFASGGFAYQWSRCLEDVCQPIAGATGTSYLAGPTDVGRSLKVTVTATGAGGETDSAESNIAGAISGHVYAGSRAPANLVPFAPVQVCRRTGSPCRSTTTDANGFYRVQAPLIGKFRVTAFPPAGSDAVSRTRSALTRVRAETDTSDQDVVLGVVKPPPPQVSLGGAGVRSQSAGGVPVVHWQEPFVIDYESDLDNEVEARLEFPDGQQLRVQPQLPIEPSPKDPENGIFRFPIQPLYPNHGAARVTIVVHAPRTEVQIEEEEEETEEEEAEEEEDEEEEDEEEEENEEEDEEPEEDEETEEEEDEGNDEEDEEEEQEEDEEEEDGPGGPEETTFPIYIDPSGFVRTVDGAPLGGAKVTLYQSLNKNGPFTVVPNGSALMSPMNRKNPDLSEADGHFGWDVIAGFYKVRVEKSGCHAPAQPGAPFVETEVMTIPPPVTNLDLRLQCPVPVDILPNPPFTSPTPRPAALRASLVMPRDLRSVRVGKKGEIKLGLASAGCPEGSPGPCVVTFAASAPAPPKKDRTGKGAKKSAAKAKAPLKLGTRTSSLAAGATAPLEGKLSAGGLSLLKKLGRLKATTLAISIAVPGAETAKSSLFVTLLPPRKQANKRP